MIFKALRNVGTIKELLELAATESGRTDDDAPGPEHMVLAALALGDGTAAAALAAVGTDERNLRAAIDRTRRDALASVGVEPLDDTSAIEPVPGTGPYRSTAPAQRTFQAAAKLSKASGSKSLLGAHVVAAAMDEAEPGTLGRALRALGVDPADLRAAALAAGSR